MGRFFNREALASALVLLLVGALIGYFSPLDTWIRIAIVIGIPAIFHWPIAIWVQDKFLNLYVEHCRYDSALRLAVSAKEAAMDRWSRQDATLNLAFVQLAQGNYDAALRNLKSIIVTHDHPITKCVVNGVTGYCLARMGKDLDKAEELVAAGIEALPEDGLFVIFLALIRLRQGRFEEAKLLLEKAQELEDDPSQPHPGELPFMMAQALAGMGDMVQAKACLEASAAANPRAIFTIQAKAILASGDLSKLNDGLVVQGTACASGDRPTAADSALAASEGNASGDADQGKAEAPAATEPPASDAPAADAPQA